MAVRQCLADASDDGDLLVEAEVWVRAQECIEWKFALQMLEDDARSAGRSVREIAAELQDVRVVREKRQMSGLAFGRTDKLLAAFDGHALGNLVSPYARLDAR